MTAPESSPKPADKAISHEEARKALRLLSANHFDDNGVTEEQLVQAARTVARYINEQDHAAIQGGDGRLTGRQLAEKHGFKRVSPEQFEDNVAAYTGGPATTPPADEPCAKPAETSGATPAISPADERLKHFTQQELDDAAGELGDSDEGRRQFPKQGADAQEWRARAESYHDRWNKAEHELAKAKEDLAVSEGARERDLKDELARLKAENARLVADSARIDWLEKHANFIEVGHVDVGASRSEIDEAIKTVTGGKS